MRALRRWCGTVAALGAVLGLAAAAYGFSNILLLHGTLRLQNYDGFFAEDYPDYSGRATVEFTAFTMKPGDAFPWHYHEGMAYAVLVKGTVTEDEGCGTVRQFSAGAGFVERPGRVHRVINYGRGSAIIYAALMYPVTSTDVVVTEEPTCP
jgi:quercetin dioxygenase-like cupin family protein